MTGTHFTHFKHYFAETFLVRGNGSTSVNSVCQVCVLCESATKVATNPVVTLIQSIRRKELRRYSIAHTAMRGKI